MSRIPIVLQSEAAECGLACLVMVARSLEIGADLDELRSLGFSSDNGITLSRLSLAARHIGLRMIAYRVEPADLADMRPPLLLHWNMTHYVVLERVSGDRFHIIDPSIGRRSVSADEFSASFTGIAAEFTVLQTGYTPPPNRWRAVRWLWGLVRRHRGTAARVLFYSVSLQGLALLLPLFLKRLIDSAPGSWSALAYGLVGMFLALAVLLGLATYLRGRDLAEFGSRLSANAKKDYFRHLFSLPLAFFQRRRPSEIIARIRSLDAIEAFVSRRTVEALIDGAVLVFATILVLSISWQVGAATLVFLALLALLKLSFVAPLDTAARERLSVETAETCSAMESVACVEQLVLAGAVAGRLHTLHGLTEDTAHAIRKENRLRAQQSGFERLLLSLDFAVFAIIASVLLGKGVVTPGGIYALMAYKGLVSAQGASLAGALQEARTLRAHFDRLYDVLGQQPADSDPLPSAQAYAPVLQFAGVTFKYPGADRATLRDVTLSVPPGQLVAVTGESGAGKSTFLRLILGLAQPISGTVAFGSVSAVALRKSALCGKVAGVLQTDSSLLEGTLEENITLFDHDPREADLLTAIAVAQLGDWMRTLPAGKSTPVISPRQVSGGQLQRIMLARALYNRPDVLVLDEATSSLDEDTEKVVMDGIRRMGVSVIFSTHRESIARMAERVIRVEDGRVGVDDLADDLASSQPIRLVT